MGGPWKGGMLFCKPGPKILRLGRQEESGRVTKS